MVDIQRAFEISAPNEFVGNMSEARRLLGELASEVEKLREENERLRRWRKAATIALTEGE